MGFAGHWLVGLGRKTSQKESTFAQNLGTTPYSTGGKLLGIIVCHRTFIQTCTCYERVVLGHVKEEDGPECRPHEGEGRGAIEYPHPAAVLHNHS